MQIIKRTALKFKFLINETKKSNISDFVVLKFAKFLVNFFINKKNLKLKNLTHI